MWITLLLDLLFTILPEVQKSPFHPQLYPTPLHRRVNTISKRVPDNALETLEKGKCGIMTHKKKL